MSNIEQLKANTESAWNRLCAANKEADRLRHEWCLLRDELEVAESAAAEEAKKDATAALVEAATRLLDNAAFNDGVGIVLTHDAEPLEAALKLARGEV